MRTPTIAATMAAALASFPLRAHAQPDLPPPPPPPLAPPNQTLPPPPPPPVPPQSTAPAPRYEPAPPAQPPYGHPRHRREPAVIYEEPPARPVAITVNPLALVLGRLSANVEILLAPHHSIVLSPNLLLFEVDRGGRYNFESEGLGFASRASGGFGVEVGYHYWWPWRRMLAGPYIGPSLLLGSVNNATVGTTTNAQTYWGAAIDAGGQAVFPGGFTIGGGLGVGLVSMASAVAVFPRFLLQLGWSF